jgi:hypothetical protein
VIFCLFSQTLHNAIPLEGLGTHIYSPRGCTTLHCTTHYTTHCSAQVLSSRCSSTVKRLLLLLSYNSQKTAATAVLQQSKDCCCYCPTAVKRLLLSYNRDAVRIVLFTTKQRCCPPHEDRMTYSIILPLSLVRRLWES